MFVQGTAREFAWNSGRRVWRCRCSRRCCVTSTRVTCARTTRASTLACCGDWARSLARQIPWSTISDTFWTRATTRTLLLCSPRTMTIRGPTAGVRSMGFDLNWSCHVTRRYSRRGRLSLGNKTIHCLLMFINYFSCFYNLY